MFSARTFHLFLNIIKGSKSPATLAVWRRTLEVDWRVWLWPSSGLRRVRLPIKFFFILQVLLEFLTLLDLHLEVGGVVPEISTLIPLYHITKCVLDFAESLNFNIFKVGVVLRNEYWCKMEQWHVDSLVIKLEKRDNWPVCWSLQVWRLRRRVPRRVSTESSALSSLRSPRTPPQEAVLLLVTWRRQPRVLPPALPRHLRHTKAVTMRALPGRDAGQSACFSDLCASPGQIGREDELRASSGLFHVCVPANTHTHTWAKPPLSYCKKQGENQQKDCCTRLYKLNYLYFVVTCQGHPPPSSSLYLFHYLHLFLILGV